MIGIIYMVIWNMVEIRYLDYDSCFLMSLKNDFDLSLELLIMSY